MKERTSKPLEETVISYSWSGYKRVGGSQYKYVSEYRKKDGTSGWSAKMVNSKIGKTGGKMYATEHEAAKAVDLYLIGQGKEPLNVLKRK